MDEATCARLKANMTVVGECWEWQLAIDRDGYGRVAIDTVPHPAHRVMYEAAVAPIPAGLVIDHLCRNRACINPDHLEPVTNKVNILRGVSGPAENARKTHCIRGHEFTPENTKLRKNGKRNCRTCTAADDRAYRRRRRAA